MSRTAVAKKSRKQSVVFVFPPLELSRSQYKGVRLCCVDVHDIHPGEAAADPGLNMVKMLQQQ